MNIILVGYMGCGKTTVGRHIANNKKMLFLDTDEAIEDRQGRSISDIFAVDGEEAFRDMETEYLEEMVLKRKDGFVISTGGGMALREKNRELLKKLGTVFYLRTKPETVYKRIKGDTKRPLLQCEDPLSKIKEMTALRDEFYQDAADYILDTDDMIPVQIADEILKRYE